MCNLHCTAGLQLQVVDAQNKAQMEVAAVRAEADRVQALLDASQQQVNRLQQQLADAQVQQATLRSSFVQLEAAADPGLSIKIQAEARWV
jgi:chromosome segregation ATPase